MTEWAKGSKNEGLNEEIKFMTITNERLEECMKKQTTDFLTKTVNEIMNKRINGKGEKWHKKEWKNERTEENNQRKKEKEKRQVLKEKTRERKNKKEKERKRKNE